MAVQELLERVMTVRQVFAVSTGTALQSQGEFRLSCLLLVMRISGLVLLPGSFPEAPILAEFASMLAAQGHLDVAEQYARLVSRKKREISKILLFSS